MARDRYERKHRRTASNVNSVEFMAGADFDAAPSLAESMGLESTREPMETYAYVGHKAHVGHSHSGRLFGHTTPSAGRRHALNGGPDVFTSLCGETVYGETHDQFGFRYEGGARNVWTAGNPGAAGVTCKRCLRKLGGK